MKKRKSKKAILKPSAARTTEAKQPATTVARTVLQAALPITDPLESSFQGELRKRLGHRAFVSVSLVASACDVSVMTVFSWIQSGEIEARNVSVAPRPYYRIFAPSVIRFFERMQP
jgi:hypothetical protein